MADLKINITAAGGAAAASEVKKITAATGELAAASKQVAPASKEAGDALDQFGRKGSAAKDAFEGVAQVANGGAASLFGFAKAWINVRDAFAANPITAILGVLLGSLALVQKAFGLLVERAEASRDAMFGTGEKTRALATALATVKAESATAMVQMQADVTSLTTLYTTLNTELARSTAAFAKIENARAGAEVAGLQVQRQQALDAPGADPTAINADFEQRIAKVKADSALAITNRETGAARLREINAQDLIASIEAQRTELTRKLAAAEIAFESATNEGSAAIARGRTKETEREITEFDAQNSPRLAGAQADIADARATIKAAEFGDVTRTLTGIVTQREQARTARIAATSPLIAQAKESALTLAGEAPGGFRPEVYKEDFGISTERRKAEKIALEGRNASRQAAIAAAAAGVEKAAAQLGDGKDEASDLQALEAALSKLANSAALNGSATLRQLAARIQTIEAQLKNTDR